MDHLPMEISRVTKLRSSQAQITADLVQVGVEIFCIIMFSMAVTVVIHFLEEKYGEHAKTLYTETKDEKILGSFLHI